VLRVLRILADTISGGGRARTDRQLAGHVRKNSPERLFGGSARLLRLFVHRWERATRLDLAPRDTLSRVGLLVNAFPELSGNSVWHRLVCQEKFPGI